MELISAFFYIFRRLQHSNLTIKHLQSFPQFLCITLCIRYKLNRSDSIKPASSLNCSIFIRKLIYIIINKLYLSSFKKQGPP